MITVGMNYQVIRGKEAEFEAVFASVLELMKRMDGHRHTRLFRDVAEPGSYLIHSEWRDRGAFDAFTSSAQFRNVTDWGKSKILAAQPRHEIYGDPTPAVAAAAPDPATAPTGRCPMHKG